MEDRVTTSTVLCTNWYTNRPKKFNKPRKLTPLGIHHATTIVTNTESTVTLSKVNKAERDASFHAHFLYFCFHIRANKTKHFDFLLTFSGNDFVGYMKSGQAINV